MSGPYTDLADSLRTDGVCIFDAVALEVLGKYQAVDKVEANPDGVKVELQDDKGAVIAEVLVHDNGRKEAKGEKDLQKDSLVIPLSTLATFPEDLQAALWAFEQVPYGRREPFLGGDVIEVRI